MCPRIYQFNLTNMAIAIDGRHEGKGDYERETIAPSDEYPGGAVREVVRGQERLFQRNNPKVDMQYPEYAIGRTILNIRALMDQFTPKDKPELLRHEEGLRMILDRVGEGLDSDLRKIADQCLTDVGEFTSDK